MFTPRIARSAASSAVALAIALGALSIVGTAPAAAAQKCGSPHNPFYGKVDHVSGQNLKVTSRSGITCSFIYTPHVSQIRLGNGGTKMAQQKAIGAGDYAQVSWKTFLGFRHATKIIDSSYPLNVQNQ